MMNLGLDQPLYILHFDHRGGSFENKRLLPHWNEGREESSGRRGHPELPSLEGMA
jgi:hypothetical protein